MLFPHDKHVDVVGDRRRSGSDSFPFVRVSLRGMSTQDAGSKSCAVCHETYQPQGKSKEEFVTTPPKGLDDEAFCVEKGRI